MSASEPRATDPTPAGAPHPGPSCSRNERDGPYPVAILGVGSATLVFGSREERIASIAERQRGRVARRQLLAAGIPSAAIGRRVASQRLVREHPCVYAVRPVLDVPLARETAALLACGPKALLSHSSAAALWGIAEPTTGPVEVTVSRRRHRTTPGIVAHRTGHLLARDVRVEQGLPVTSPARTLLDRAGALTPLELERELDEALAVKRIVTRDELHDVLERGGGRSGAATLRGLLHRRENDSITQSEAERLFLRLIRASGLPEPVTQVRIAGYTVDFLWPEHRVVFEIDGYRFHTSRRAFDRDRRKDRALKEAGYDPNRVSRDQVKHEPLAVVAQVAAALARASR